MAPPNPVMVNLGDLRSRLQWEEFKTAAAVTSFYHYTNHKVVWWFLPDISGETCQFSMLIILSWNLSSRQRNSSSGFQNSKFYILKTVILESSYYWFSVLVSILTELVLAHFTI